MTSITPREEQVLHLIAYENTTTEIAKKLYMSSSTVDTVRKNLCSKFQARNTAGLIIKGVESGILQLHAQKSF